jgi:hypothetical protein
MTETAFNYNSIAAGSDEVATTKAVITSGQNLAQYAPLGQVAATGKLVIWAPGASDGSEKAVYMTANAIDASGADVSSQVYKAGTFNTDLVAFPAATDVQKLTCFVGTPISLQTLA